MSPQSPATYSAFWNDQRLATGTLVEIALAAKGQVPARDLSRVHFFSDETGKVIDLDLRGTEAELRKRLEATGHDPTPVRASGPGRPKLGVTSREISLLPRHWEWLALQPGGASLALRKLVDEASERNDPRDRKRRAQDAAYRFMNAMAGNLAGFEEALRALYAAEETRFREEMRSWPKDIRAHAQKLAKDAF